MGVCVTFTGCEVSLCYECKYKPANGGAKWRKTNPPAGPNENEAWAF